MANSIKLILKVSAAIAALLILLIAIFIADTILSAPLVIFENIVSEEKVDRDQSRNMKLETGSGANFEMLKNYILFSQHEAPFESWLDAKGDKIKIAGKGQILLQSSVELPLPLVNDCEQVYCFQKRIKFEKIPPIFWKGLIGIEDERFLLHAGVDLKSLVRALVHDIKVMRLEQGGSTLTQQIVKNLFYTNEKKFSRKLKEMILAVYLESKFEKEKILEAYFNEVVWGGKQGIKIKGLLAASIFYFSKKPDKISPYEAAILISLLKGPNFYNPLAHEKRLRDRADLVYSKLVKMNLFPSAREEKWNSKNWEIWISRLRELQEKQPYRDNWWLSKNLENGELSFYERYVFHSQASALLGTIKKKLQDRDIAVKAYFGDIKEKTKSYFYYSKYERDWNIAKSEERHTLGSTIKPIIYSLLVKLGSNMEKEVETGPIEVKLKSGSWSPREAHEIPERWISLSQALKLSYNRPIIRESQAIGFDKLELEMEKIFPDIKKPLGEYPAQLLGTVEVSLLQLFNIYQDFIINDCSGEKESVVEILSNPKETTIRKLVGDDFGGLKFFGKTGTSNNGFDNWFVFYEGNRLGIIWVGLEGERSGGDLKLYGGTTSFQIFKRFYLNSGKRFGEFLCSKNSLSN